MNKTVEQMMQEMYDRIVRTGRAPNVALTMQHLPASLWEAEGIKPTTGMKKTRKEAVAAKRSLNNIYTSCWNINVVVGGVYPIRPGGLYALTAPTACRKMLVLVKQFCHQCRKGLS